MAEIPFEYLAVALEATRGTAIANPTHYMALEGMMRPRKSRARPTESRGTLARSHRSVTTRRWGEWEGEGPVDFFALPVLFNILLKGGVTSPTTPSGATTTRLWEFKPTMNADNLQSGTMWWGDPNVQIWQAAFAMIDEFGVESDATSEDEVRMSLSGFSHFPTKVADPTLPTQLVSPLAIPGSEQLWVDVASPMGTTAIDSRFLGGDVTIPGGLTRKWGSKGPTNDKQYARVGRDRRNLEANLRFELLDTAQYDLMDSDDVARIRWRINGPLIETVALVDFYHYLEFEFWAPVEEMDWSDNEGTNRVIDLNFLSEYDTVEGTDFIVRVQNNRNSL